MDDRKEKLIARRWRSGNKTVIFLMPETPWDYEGGQCESWEPVGGHGGADYHGVIAKTRPLPVSEAQKELDRYVMLYPGAAGIYVLAQRAAYQDHERRRNRAFQINHKAEHGT